MVNAVLLAAALVVSGGAPALIASPDDEVSIQLEQIDGALWWVRVLPYEDLARGTINRLILLKSAELALDHEYDFFAVRLLVDENDYQTRLMTDERSAAPGTTHMGRGQGPQDWHHLTRDLRGASARVELLGQEEPGAYRAVEIFNRYAAQFGLPQRPAVSD